MRRNRRRARSILRRWRRLGAGVAARKIEVAEAGINARGAGGDSAASWRHLRETRGGALRLRATKGIGSQLKMACLQKWRLAAAELALALALDEIARAAARMAARRNVMAPILCGKRHCSCRHR